MGLNPETLPLGGAAPSRPAGPSYTVVATLSALLFASALLNVGMFVNQPGQNPALGAAPSCGPGQQLQCADIAAARLGSVSVTPGTPAQESAEGGVGYCRKDTWLLSCLFYKSDINDELTDWKSVKSECDREPQCDGVNKYWTSDLWHISSSGKAPGCDPDLKDGNGTDASAFYKEGTEGYRLFTADGTCRLVDEWGNP